MERTLDGVTDAVARAPSPTDAAPAAVLLRDHARVQDLLLAHGSATQREFVAAEAVGRHRFAGAWPVLRWSDDRVAAADGAERHLRLLPRPAGGRLLIGYQHVPAHLASADWAVFRVHDRGTDLLALVPHGTPRLRFDAVDRSTGVSGPSAAALLNGVRVLDSWLVRL